MSEQGTMLVDEAIREFRGADRFLSNFWVGAPIEVSLRGMWGAAGGAWEGGSGVWEGTLKGKSVEHLFQALKVEWRDREPLEVMDELRWVLGQEAPGEAKRAGSAKGLDGRSITLRGDWEQVKVPVMLRILRAKFAPIAPKGLGTASSLDRMLMNTSPRVLIEGNTWGDDYWGVVDRGHGRGKNMLGRLLMLVRAELLAAHAAGIPVESLR